MRPHRIVLALALLALIAAACGDDADGGALTTTSAGSVTTRAGDTTEPPTTSGEGTTAAGAGDIGDLLARYRQTPLRTTYLMGEDGTEMTFSQDPTANPPVSAMISGQGKAIFYPDSMIFCSGEGAGAQCFEMASDVGTETIGATLSPWAMLALVSEDLTASPGFHVETDPISVAGRSGVCFTFTPDIAIAAGTDWVRQCVDDELGFTLLLEVKAAGADPRTEMELTAVGDPQSGDFEPTGPVMTMPTG